MAEYDCGQCPGYCCSYPVIQVTKADVKRLAKHFGISEGEAEKRFTKDDHGHKQILRRKSDEIYGRICKLFDTAQRNCSVYAARPGICRQFPGEGRCGYYDFLSFERETQEDPEHIALTDSGAWR